MEIHCSSFPPPRPLVYSSPASASFRPYSSMFSILTAFLSLFNPYVLSSVFVHIHPTHTPFASSSPGSAGHLPPSTCWDVTTLCIPLCIFLFLSFPFIPLATHVLVYKPIDYSWSPQSVITETEVSHSYSYSSISLLTVPSILHYYLGTASIQSVITETEYLTLLSRF